MWSHARITRFPMQTANGPSPQPVLGPLARINNQSEVTFSSVRGEKYVLHTSTGLPTWAQGPTIVANGPSTLFRFASNAAPAGFYRVVIAP
jgi:hypothetical protein